MSTATKQKQESEKILIVYFLATGTTKDAAEKLKMAIGGKLYRIKAVQPYTSADLEMKTMTAGQTRSRMMKVPDRKSKER